jgi:hypothetical protein
MQGVKLIPTKCNTDIAADYMPVEYARFIKNLTSYVGATNEYAGIKEGQNELKLKPLQANELYVQVQLPVGDNFCIGAKGFPITNEVYVLVYNSLNNHCIYRVNGNTRTSEILAISPLFNFQLKPEYFVGEAQITLDVHKYIDPDTGEELTKKDLYWTDGFGYQGFLRADDAIATNGFDPVLYPYFQGRYDRGILYRMGLPTPTDCVQIKEVYDYEVIQQGTALVTGVAPNQLIIPSNYNFHFSALDQIDIQSNTPIVGVYNIVSVTFVNTNPNFPLQGNYILVVDRNVPNYQSGGGNLTLLRRTSYSQINNLLFNTWQFRIKVTDVYGRPSEHSIISDMYVAGVNDCIGSTNQLPRCLDLIFDAGNPLWDTVDIEYRNCNDTNWFKTETLFLYLGSSLGKWWTRQRNPAVRFDATNHTISYKFCADGEQNIIDPLETSRLENPLPKKSQSLIKITNKIGLLNNTEGFLPFPITEKNKIVPSIIPPQSTPIKSRTITVYVPIYARWLTGAFIGGNGFIQNGNVFTAVENINGQYVFGFPTLDNPVQYGQYFPKSTGFIGYLLGSESVAISTQVYIDASGNVIPDPQHLGLTQNSALCFQKFEFTNVRSGTYVFRLASHLADPNNLGSQSIPLNSGTFPSIFSTSTTVWGKCNFDPSTKNIDINSRDQYYSQELVIDVCNDDYDTFLKNPNKEVLVISDLTRGTYNNCGYIYETEVNGYPQYPMELMQVIGNGSGLSCNITDHNGFFWESTTQKGRSFNFYFIYKCQKVNFNFARTASGNIIEFRNFFLDEHNDVLHGDWLDYSTAPCNHIDVIGRVVLVSNGNIGIPNVLVVLTRGQYAYTDANGYYHIRAHDSTVSAIRNDEIVMSGSVCNYTGLNGSCIPTEPVVINQCSYGSCPARVFYVNDINVFYTAYRGLLSGGTYGIGVVGWDWLGRGTYIQDLGKVNVPTVTQSKAIAPSELQVTINPSLTLPTEIKYLTFWITNELTIEDYIDWIVDRFELVDATGAINNQSPSQIRIYYQSLNEYNSVNNFSTTTNWQFLETAPVGQGTSAQQPVTNDVVQFLVNGNGSFNFSLNSTYSTKQVVSLVKYNQTGQYFLIDYTTDLDGLKENALIRLVRPRKVINESEPYYELCKILPVVNGKVREYNFKLNAFDTYYLDRQIPVPVPTTPTPTVTQIATTNGAVTTYETPVPTTQALSLRVFPYAFEHNSPSNFWGYHCKNIGRVNIVNPYETELIKPNDIALSGALSPTGQLNYLQYFDNAQKQTFDIFDTSGICAAFATQGILWCITQFDNFLVGYGDNLPRFDNAGNLTAPSAANTFGKPERKTGEVYGCMLQDKTAIGIRNGLIMFPDRNRGEILQFNFSKLDSLTKDKCDAWFRLKCKTVNSNPLKYFSHIINPITNEYFITDFTIGSDNYINQLRTYDARVNETVSFDIYTKDLRQWHSFIPERGAFLDGDTLAVQMFSFKKAQPYSHYNANQNSAYNTYYGVICERVFEIISNKEPFKKKKYNNISVYCKQSKYFSDLITTESGQKSYLMLSDFDQALYFTMAAFNQDLNTPTDPNYSAQINNNPISEGNPLYGEWISIRLIGEPSMNDKYSEVLGVVVDSFDYEKTGS